MAASTSTNSPSSPDTRRISVTWNSETVTARVDDQRRRDIMANHTATHLLHWALKEVVSQDANQKGSLVHPDYLRFDFTLDKGVTAEQLAEIAVTMRHHASLNPQAKMRKPITHADVLESRMISTPLHLLDCCIISDGGGAVVVTVADEGAGIAPEHVQRIVDPFFTMAMQPGYEMGQRAAEILIARLAAGKAETITEEVLLPTEIVEYQSTAPPTST